MQIKKQSVAIDQFEADEPGFDEDWVAEQFTANHQRLTQIIKLRMDGRLQGRVDPEDIFQEAYLDAVKRLASFHDQISVFVQIRQILLQTLTDVHRRHLVAQVRNVSSEVTRQATHKAQSSITLVRLLKAGISSPSSPLRKRETCQQVNQAIKTLGEMDCEVLLMRHFEDMTNGEIAETLQINPVAASRRYLRALERLKSVLENLPHFKDE